MSTVSTVQLTNNSMPDIFQALTSGSPTILLALMVIVLAAVVVYQNKDTKNNTVPKDIFDKQSARFDKISEIMQSGFSGISEAQSKILTIIDERLKK